MKWLWGALIGTAAFVARREYADIAPRVARSLILFTSRLLPMTKRERMREEWLAELVATQTADNDSEGLAYAVGICGRYVAQSALHAMDPQATVTALWVATPVVLIAPPQAIRVLALSVLWFNVTDALYDRRLLRRGRTIDPRIAFKSRRGVYALFLALAAVQAVVAAYWVSLGSGPIVALAFLPLGVTVARAFYGPFGVWWQDWRDRREQILLH